MCLHSHLQDQESTREKGTKRDKACQKQLGKRKDKFTLAIGRKQGAGEEVIIFMDREERKTCNGLFIAPGLMRCAAGRGGDISWSMK